MSGKRFRALDHVFDESTERTLFGLAAKDYFNHLQGPIAIGKESHVFTAIAGNGLRVVKVYRSAAPFRRMYDYLKIDPRFAHVRGTKLSILYIWARKEYRNLLRARQGNVCVPTPFVVEKNVLVMEYIPGLQLARNTPKNVKRFYEKLIKEIQKLLAVNLVHADLSEYNILVFKDAPVIIDFSHAVDLRYPGVERLFRRDIENVVQYFKKHGLELNAEEVITQLWKRKS